MSRGSVPTLQKSSLKRIKNASVSKSDPVSTELLDQSLGYSLRRAQLSTYPFFVEAMEGLGVRPSEFAILILVLTNPGASQSAISDALNVQKANFVPLLDKLETRGLVERCEVPGDRRYSALHLTTKGEQFVEQMQEAHAAYEARLASRLGARKSRELLRLVHEFSRVQ